MGLNSISSFQVEAAETAGRPLIVVVEDNPTDVFMIREAITSYGLNADLETMEDGQTAVDFIERIDADESTLCPSLMLLDINLPRTDGFAVLERLRRSKRCADVPVIMMTSSATRADRTKATDLGTDVYFQKPCGYDAFIKIGDIIGNLL
jgi:DNA-binding response OmpR family regulator